MGSGLVLPSMVPPPDGLGVVPYNESAVQIQWEANGVSTVYTVRYSPVYSLGDTVGKSGPSYHYLTR